ncbi:hypothetical protein AB0D83_41225, partial [Streptomyces decoyicus]|uniref:hypothetical protein n=1 Tax=Streptomyces decoyicus TaxID=249567 RepID=UPI003486D9FE
GPEAKRRRNGDKPLRRDGRQRGPEAKRRRNGDKPLRRDGRQRGPEAKRRRNGDNHYGGTDDNVGGQ